MSQVDEELRRFKDANSSERLRAARRLSGLAETKHLAQLRTIRSQERDSWVRSAIDATINRLAIGGAIEEFGQAWVSPPADEVTEDMQAIAIRNASQPIVHEIRQILRVLASAAEEEVVPHSQSRTVHEIHRLTSFLVVVERLQSAAEAPTIVDFDLRDLILRTVRDAGYTEDQVILFQTAPTTVSGDPELLELALRNLICNAVEASEDSGRRVTVNFSRNDRENWVVVLDEGKGLPGSVERAWDPGVTTKSKKDGHFGWGLSIAQRATHSFRGKISLAPRESGGSAAEIRWPAQKEDSRS